ncbi:hypothetical protein [Oryzibacter oryziterrae]|uniref:hypothetical protein n=1 Tax=Oryzibacter oryziterrae TaxID=2766474 RepID=UPI001F3DB2C2|nr:hypothetical protein [Oryzibacter oryziterrae]
MLELVLLVCMQSSPTQCRDEKLSFDGGPIACVQFGQVAAADWVANHPKWMIRQWKCAPRSRII